MAHEITTLTIAEVAKVLKVSEKTIIRMLQEGSIPGFKVANQWRFHPEDFNRWLNSKRREGDSAARSGIATMMSQEIESIPLSRLTSEDLVVMDVPAGSKEEILKALTHPLVKKGIVTDEATFINSLLVREGMMSTGVGGGVALPHIRYPQDVPLDRPSIVIGICKTGAEWKALDGEPVRLFLLPVTGNEVIHVRVLSTIRQALIIDGMIDLLVEAEAPKDVMSILIQIETIQQSLMA